MLTKFKKNKKTSSAKNIFFPILLGISVLLFIGLLVGTNIKISQRRTKLTAQISALKKEIQILEQKNRELKEGVSRAGSEESLEKVARDKLGLRAPGEEVVVVTKGEEKEKETEEAKKSWWEWIKSIFSR